jgi:glycosyltransferase involved in cell wall biosynthesis
MLSPPAPGDRPLVSVIITSYNYAQYISESISSVLMQDVPGLELIVVDNASTDATDEVVSRFAGDSRLHYHKNPTNIGLTPNHNRGLELARGRYIAFLSADDRLLAGHLRRCVEYLEAHPAIDVVYTGALFMDANGTPYMVRDLLGQLPVDYDGGRNEFAAQLSEGCYVPWPAMLARRSLYDDLGPLHLMTAADFELTVRWAAARRQFGYLRVQSASIRLHKAQASGPAYVAAGHDLNDYLEILDKFLVPENEDLFQGYQGVIAAHLAWRADYHRQSKGSEISSEVAARVEALTQRLASVPQWPATERLNGRPLISIVVRYRFIPLLLLALESLARQTDAPAWEAIVVGENGPDLGPLLAAQPYAANVRFVRMDERESPAAARNLGQRLAAGRVITYLEPGSTFGASHLANLERAFASGAQVVRGDVRFLLCDSHDGTPLTVFREIAVAGVYRGATDEERDLIAPAVPIDAIAHVRATIQRTGGFRVDLPACDAWEYWLRLKSLGPTAFIPGPAVDVRVLRQSVLPPASYLNVAHAIYRAYAAQEESALAERRAIYLKEITPHLERGNAAIGDERTAVEAVATFLGIREPVLAPNY